MTSPSSAAQCSADPLLTEEQAAHLLNLKPSTLQGWRHRRTGPPYQKLRSLVRYRQSAIMEWLEGRTVRPADEAAQA